MNGRELTEIIEKYAPLSMASDWDNSGLQLGRLSREVHGVYIALDATSVAVEAAIREKCDFLLTHHPLIFHGIKSIGEEEAEGRRLLRLAETGVACYASHTSYDAAPGRMGDLAAGRLGLTQTQPILPSGEGGWIGRVGRLTEAMPPKKLAAFVRRAFGLPRVTLYAASDAPVSVAGILPGSGKDEWKEAMALGAEAYITGDMSHHSVLDAAEAGLTVIDAGHFGTEWFFVPDMAQLLEKHTEGLRIVQEQCSFPGEIDQA